MPARRKRLIVALVAWGTCLLVAAGVAYRYSAHYLNGQEMQLTQVYRAYSHYLRDHSHRLPGRFDDLTRGGYLIPADPRDGRAFLGPPARGGEFLPVYRSIIIRDVRSFGLLYDGSLSDFEINARGVCRRNGQEPVCFVTPACTLLMKRSRELTKQVMEHVNDLAPSAQPEQKTPGSGKGDIDAPARAGEE